MTKPAAEIRGVGTQGEAKMLESLLTFFDKAKETVEKAGYGDEIRWCDELKPFDQQTYGDFAAEYIWVVISSGINNRAAQTICERFWYCVRGEGLITHEGHDPFLTIAHPHKQKAIRRFFKEGRDWFELLQKADDKVAFIGDYLPYMGGEALRYHLARNLGIDCVKPDRHLKRLAEFFGFPSPLEMCLAIQAARGGRLGVIDVILWRYSNLVGTIELVGRKSE